MLMFRNIRNIPDEKKEWIINMMIRKAEDGLFEEDMECILSTIADIGRDLI